MCDSVKNENSKIFGDVNCDAQINGNFETRKFRIQIKGILCRGGSRGRGGRGRGGQNLS